MKKTPRTENGFPQPKFKVGDLVRLSKPDLEGNTDGEITRVEKLFKELDPYTGKFKRSGLVTMESTIEAGCLPKRFDGWTLEVDFPQQEFDSFIQKAWTMKSFFYGYACTVKASKTFSTSRFENDLTLLKSAPQQ